MGESIWKVILFGRVYHNFSLNSIAEYNKPTDLYAINKLYVEIKNAEIKIPTDGIDEINVSIKVRIAAMTNNKIIQQ